MGASSIVASKSTSASAQNVIIYYLNDYWKSQGDPRTRDFPFLETGPWKIIAIIFFYLYFIALSWPRFSDNKLINQNNNSIRRRSLSRSNQNQRQNSRDANQDADENCNDNKVPFVILLNGLLLGLNGAWFLIGFLISTIGQSLINPIMIASDAKTIEFYALLRIYLACLFLSFQIILIFISVLIIYASKSFETISAIEIAEQVALPLIIYSSVKFKYYDFILIASLITTLIGFIANCYSTLCYADALDNNDIYGDANSNRDANNHRDADRNRDADSNRRHLDNGHEIDANSSAETLEKYVAFLKIFKFILIYYVAIYYLILTTNFSLSNFLKQLSYDPLQALASVSKLIREDANLGDATLGDANLGDANLGDTNLNNETPISIKLLPIIYSSIMYLVSWFSVSRRYFDCTIK